MKHGSKNTGDKGRKNKVRFLQNEGGGNTYFPKYHNRKFDYLRKRFLSSKEAELAVQMLYDRGAGSYMQDQIMGKRYTDSEKYKKPFVRSLKGAYKLLWDYLYHDCDNSGIWIVDFEIAQIYLGADMPVNAKDAIRFFNAEETRIFPFENGKKWFIPSFISFQYNELSETNPAHKKVILTLKNLGFLENGQVALKYLKRDKAVPTDGTMDMEEGMVVGVGVEKETVMVGKKSKKKLVSQNARDVIHYLNEAYGSRYKEGSAGSAKLIDICLEEVEGDIQVLFDVIDYKIAEWKGTENQKHITPETIFRLSNFQKYINQVQNVKDQKMTVAQIRGANGQKDTRVFKEDLTERTLRRAAELDAQRNKP